MLHQHKCRFDRSLPSHIIHYLASENFYMNLCPFSCKCLSLSLFSRSIIYILFSINVFPFFEVPGSTHMLSIKCIIHHTEFLSNTKAKRKIEDLVVDGRIILKRNLNTVVGRDLYLWGSRWRITVSTKMNVSVLKWREIYSVAELELFSQGSCSTQFR
jgi:hypothetical protein